MVFDVALDILLLTKVKLQRMSVYRAYEMCCATYLFCTVIKLFKENEYSFVFVVGAFGRTTECRKVSGCLLKWSNNELPL